MTPTPPSAPDSRAPAGSVVASRVRPAARYGDRNSSRRQLVTRTVMAVLAIGALAAWIWVAYAQSDKPVRGQLVGYGDITDTSIAVRWTVVREPGTAVVCVIRAQDASGVEVGRARVDIAAGPATEVHLEHQLVTLARPLVAELLDCHVAG